MTTKNRIYFHVDIETMSLKPRKGKVWQIGVVVTNHNLVELETMEFTAMAAPTLWDEDTLSWATKTYGEHWAEDTYRNGYTDPACQALALAVPFEELYAAWAKVGEVWIVTNHPEFDVATLCAMFDILERKWPIKYNHSLDMGSLMVGIDSARSDQHGFPGETRTPSQILNELGKAKSAVAHTALADALDQVDTLRRVGLTLPR